ncbi:uncharacterized protein V1516DRAFT_686537 [Lipomyces oligophaga]|uniref:uncharacterized protein n=1 Tax=Lipomyces oligophaga TaxID=45792 RepID=UPI0034CD46AD
MSYHSRTYSNSSRRYNSSVQRGHASHPSIPENDVAGSSSPDTGKSLSSGGEDFDDSVSLLVQSWMDRNTVQIKNSSSPTPEVSGPKSSPNLAEGKRLLQPHQHQHQHQHQQHNQHNQHNHHQHYQQHHQQSLHYSSSPSIPTSRAIINWGNKVTSFLCPPELSFLQAQFRTKEEIRIHEQRVQAWVLMHYNTLAIALLLPRDSRVFVEALQSGRATIQLVDERNIPLSFSVDQSGSPLVTSSQQLENYQVSMQMPLQISLPTAPMRPTLDSSAAIANGLNIYAPSTPSGTGQYFPVQPVPISAATYSSDANYITPVSEYAVSTPMMQSHSSNSQYETSPRMQTPPLHVHSARSTPASQSATVFTPDMNSESVQIVRPPRESKRIPIINPDSKESVAPSSTSSSEQQTKRLSFTPLVQSGTFAKDLNQEQLDGIIERLTQATPSAAECTSESGTQSRTGATADDDTESEWSEGIQEQRLRILAEASNAGMKLDDSVLETILGEALTKKLDPLQKMMGLLADQLKYSSFGHHSGHISVAEDQDEAIEQDDSEAGNSRPVTGSPGKSSRVVSESDELVKIAHLEARNDSLLTQLDDLRREHGTSETTIMELNHKVNESQQYKLRCETYADEVERLKEKIKEMEADYEKERSDLANVSARENTLVAKEKQMLNDQVKILQDEAGVLREKIEITKSEHLREVISLQTELDRLKHRSTDDLSSSRAAELSWLRTLLDSKVAELDEQQKVILSAAAESDGISKSAVEELYATNNSAFLAAVKYGSALGHASDSFVELLRSCTETLTSRGVTTKEHRRRQSRHVLSENIMPLGDHLQNVQSPVGFQSTRSSGFNGLKNLKLSRTNTVHSGLGVSSREDVRMYRQ